jgi:hypothetical protein
MHDRQVEICIVFDALDPPVGRVRLPDGREVEFVGWLGLLEVLSQLVERADS